MVSMLAVLSPQRRLRELLDEGVALLLDGGGAAVAAAWSFWRMEKSSFSMEA